MRVRRSLLILGLVAGITGAAFMLRTSPSVRRLVLRAATALCCRADVALARQFVSALTSQDSARVLALSADTGVAHRSLLIASQIAPSLAEISSGQASVVGGSIGQSNDIGISFLTSSRVMPAYCYLPDLGDVVQLRVVQTPGGRRIAHLGLVPC